MERNTIGALFSSTLRNEGFASKIAHFVPVPLSTQHRDKTTKQPLTQHDRYRIVRKIWLSRALLGLMILHVLLGWSHIHEAPLASMIIGTCVNLVFISADVMWMRHLQKQLTQTP
jgi:hypothetical protein